MTQQFRRACTLTASGQSGGTTVTGGGRPGDLRIRGNIVSHTLQAPNQACFVITNPSQDTVSAFQQEFAEITFSAGYEDNEGQLFKGSITQTMWGEIENLTDRILRIFAADSDVGYNNAKVSATLAAGSTPQDIVNTCLQALGQFGITMGQVTGVDLSQPAFPRAYPLAGMARDYLREVALSKNASFNINAGQLNIIAKNASGPGGAIPVNSRTGLVGRAIQTQEGIIVKMLINPAVQVNSNIQLDPSSVATANFSGAALPLTQTADQSLLYRNQTNASGMYRVLHAEHELDSRGASWLQTLTCLGAGGSINPIQAGLGYS